MDKNGGKSETKQTGHDAVVAGCVCVREGS